MDTGKQYHIVDTKGHFYKLNEKNNLVMAERSIEATLFSLREANIHIGTGERASIYSIIEAENSMLGNRCDMEAESSYEPPEFDVVEIPTRFDSLHNNWESMLSNLCYMSDHMNEYQNNLNRMLSDVDKEVCDIMHYLEFNELDDGEMLRAAKMLQVRRRHRREIKDEMEKTALMRSTFLDGTFGIKVQQGLDIMERMRDRHYTPRKLNDLFQQQRATA